MQNLLDPAILFFVFGLLAGRLRSNLEIPPPIARFLSLYLLMALGLKGGFALAKSGLTAEVSISLACALLLATVIPLLGYGLLRRVVNRYDAAALAATYGSVSAVTFITKQAMQPFTGDLFKGMLAFFLLDMGLMAARNMDELKGKSPWLLAYGLLGPLVHATLALGLCWLAGIEAGNAALLMVLAASASYIAVPAVVRHAIPEANASLYFGMSLGLTFPFNILLGIPLYAAVAQRVLGQ
jgi:hypothetical protein